MNLVLCPFTVSNRGSFAGRQAAAAVVSSRGAGWPILLQTPTFGEMTPTRCLLLKRRWDPDGVFSISRNIRP